MSDYPVKQVSALIVEDYEVSSMIIKDMLSTLGVECQSAIDREEALEWMREEEFNVVFMDIQLGSESGIDVAQEIRKMDIKQPLIIACTANEAIISKEAVLKSGMDDYLTKPVSIKAFKEMLIKHHVIES